jgi:uncharacterized protein (TIGR03067 family)
MRPFLLVLVLGILAAADPKEDASRKDLEKMQGDWAAVSMVNDGFTVPDDDAQAYFRTIKGDHYTVFRYDRAIGKGTLKLDATKTPRAIDALPDGPAGKAGPVLGIYEFEGETIKVCFARPGKDRPKALVSKEGSGHTLTVWGREKK